MEIKNKIVMVTGGSGFIPSHLIKTLKKESPKHIYNFDLKVGSNLCEYHEVEEYIRDKNIDIVFDCATLSLPLSLRLPYKVVNDIVKMCLNLCELQRLGYFGKLVHISSSEAYGTAAVEMGMDETHSLKPRTPYAAGKAAADLIALSYVQTFGSNIVIPRSYNAYGPGQTLEWGAVIPKTIWKILNGEPPIIYKDGKQTRDFVFVKDIAKAIVEIAKTDFRGGVVNIGTGIETSITDLINLICKLTSYEGKIEYLEQRKADVSRHCADSTLLYGLTGFRCTTPLEKGLKETIAYYAKLHYRKALNSPS